MLDNLIMKCNSYIIIWMADRPAKLLNKLYELQTFYKG